MSDTAFANLVRYDDDIAAWAAEQARHLRAGNFAALDLENLAEEIETLGRSQRREVSSRLAVLLRHLLKWKFQPEHRSRSWRSTIRTQREEMMRVIRDNPSLRRALPEMLPGDFEYARLQALDETGLLQIIETCPWTVDQILSPEFLPD